MKTEKERKSERERERERERVEKGNIVRKEKENAW